MPSSVPIFRPPRELAIRPYALVPPTPRPRSIAPFSPRFFLVERSRFDFADYFRPTEPRKSRVYGRQFPSLPLPHPFDAADRIVFAQETRLDRGVFTSCSPAIISLYRLSFIEISFISRKCNIDGFFTSSRLFTYYPYIISLDATKYTGKVNGGVRFFGNRSRFSPSIDSIRVVRVSLVTVVSRGWKRSRD